MPRERIRLDKAIIFLSFNNLETYTDIKFLRKAFDKILMITYFKYDENTYSLHKTIPDI